MAQSASDVVITFLAECAKSKSTMRQAFQTYFTPSTVWENVGLAVTTGADGALRWMDEAAAASGAPTDLTFSAEILAIAESGNKVLTERIDRLFDRLGAHLEDIRVMGIFEVQGDRITAWRDYFDTAGMKTGNAHQADAGAT